MLQNFMAENFNDEKGNPAGGYVESIGLRIDWQNGPLKNSDGTRNPASGAFIETVLKACIQRMEYYQASKFNCRENALALTKMEEALHWLNARTQRRIAEDTEGTHQGN